MDTTTNLTVDLLVHYIFDLAGHTASELIDRWLKDHPATWVRLAVIESLYQGRYKAVSVEQILAFWKRRGQALYHFNHDFERLVCGNFPNLTRQTETNSPSPVFETGVSFSNAEVAAIATKIQVVDPTSSAEQLIQLDTNEGLHLKSDNPCPIEQFVPNTDCRSDFYTKLKAIAQSAEW